MGDQRIDVFSVAGIDGLAHAEGNADVIAVHNSPASQGRADVTEEFFGLFLKHSNIITRVTAWGVTDGDSWKNNFPVPGRVDYPLLFDRDCRPKPFVEELIGKQNI